MNQKTKKIIYVFGPKRLHDDYMSGKQLGTEDVFGYVKVGETTADSCDKWDAAYSRVQLETKTGVPETCCLYDVFEYPYVENITSGKKDDKVRRILTKDMYSLENSKENNNLVDRKEYEIKAGVEFVYGVSRKQVLNAIAKFERDLILDVYKQGKNISGEDIGQLLKMIQQNIEDCQSEDTDDDNTDEQKNSTTHQSALGDEFWMDVEKRLKEYKSNANCIICKGRPYIFVNKKQNWHFCAGYSIRYGTTTVTLETFDVDNIGMCSQVEEYIETHLSENNPIISELSSAIQGARQKNKWYWKITGSFDKSREELIKWFASKIACMTEAFSELTFTEKSEKY